MGLDIRRPIGLMFTILGSLLVVFGIIGDKVIYQRSLGVNINLWWGIVVLAFGLVMLFLGRRRTSAMKPAEENVEGQIIEEMEHVSGKEQ